MCHFWGPPIVNLPLNADGVLPLWGWAWLTASLIDTKVMQEKFVLHDTECFGKATMCAICGIVALHDHDLATRKWRYMDLHVPPCDVPAAKE